MWRTLYSVEPIVPLKVLVLLLQVGVGDRRGLHLGLEQRAHQHRLLGHLHLRRDVGVLVRGPRLTAACASTSAVDSSRGRGRWRSAVSGWPCA
jgi:hypothetical protein